MKKSRAPAVDIEALPGHYIRRLQQIAVAVFLHETEAHGVTPVQYAALQTVGNLPGIDQRTLPQRSASTPRPSLASSTASKRASWCNAVPRPTTAGCGCWR